MKRVFTLVALALLAASLAAAQEPGKMTPEQQAMMDKMMKAATPGPQHEMLRKMAGEWNATVKFLADPAQGWQESQSTSTITSLMDGRYCQEVTNGQMMGMPFSGMGVTGYDNVLGKYVSTWIDNMGTGIMTSVGTVDASGKVINWVGTMSDPMTGKATKERMVTTVTDDNHHTFEMWGVPPGQKKEMKTMTIEYVRK